MMKLPEKIRRTLEKIVKEMRVKESIYGVGLFGSWSRGDATPSSDVDLLILEKGDISHEYIERLQVSSLLIDLDHVPKRWIHGPIPPEIDQKIYEVQILYDRDWSLTNTKLLMVKFYSSPERVDIRTEAHVIESDIYLSRATSAFSREDFRSAQLFATVALENILRVLMEIALESFSNSQFLEKLEGSTAELGMLDLFNEYLGITGMRKVDDATVEGKLELFRTIWDEIHTVTKRNPQVLNFTHFKVKTKLKYYLNPAFLRGTVVRTNYLISSGKAVEAFHYLNNILLNVIENYIWLKSSIDKIKIDYTLLIRSLESLERKNPRNYGHIINFLNLGNVNKSDAASTIEKARRIILKIRTERKVLIKNHLLKS